MLDFFRRYQWYFFLLITVVVVISFSFFGTYNTLSSNSWREQLAFTAINGKEITRSDVDDMANFISTDADDKSLYGGTWGLNFLNDGVIRKDFLQTGLAQELVGVYQKEVQEDLQRRLAKEKRFKLYTHPQAHFLGTEGAWTYFAPDMIAYYGSLKVSENAADADAFNARVKLFLGEKKFPSPLLRQVLRYQERQYDWLTPDQDLDRTDLSLFGYHTLEDWFGPRFVRLVSQFIINVAILAEQKGYEISKAEVLADLVRNTETSFKQNQNNPNLGVATAQEYFNEQLRRLNMDQSAAIKVWRQVLLFRRYFQDVGNSALVDTLAYQKFNDFAKESINIDLYRLPSELRLGDYDSLQKLEIYLNAVTKRSKDDLLVLPATFLTANEVSKNYPELVQKRYILEVVKVDKKTLQNRVGIKETWNWEVEDKNWAILKKQFPELGVKKEGSREDRFAALEGLDTITRARVDAFAKSAIVDSHPEWLAKALDESRPTIKLVGLRSEGGEAPFEGINSKEKRQELMKLLDAATVGEQPTPQSKLNSYTPDGQIYYRIRVIERDANQAILTFGEANSDGSLNKLRDRLLEKYYVAIREQNPTAYQKEDQSWKNFEAVRSAVTDQYVDKVLHLDKILKTIGQKQKESAKDLSKDQLAALRMYGHVDQIKSKLKQDKAQAAQWIRSKNEQEDQTSLTVREPLEAQWKMEKIDYSVERGKPNVGVDTTDAFTLKETVWSDIKTPVNGDLAFFQVKGKGSNSDKEIAVAEQTKKAHALLSADAQRVLMRYVLQQITDKNAISLSYLDAPPPMEEAPSVVQPEI